MKNCQTQHTKSSKPPEFGEPYERIIGDTKFIITAFDNKETTETAEQIIFRLIEQTAAN
ncbi:MAG TPA: hypothetical protein DEP23_00735 [Ruminococcaceae bacterium]|nr:hypothetical protein [Oscillospiraceae bacterium]